MGTNICIYVYMYMCICKLGGPKGDDHVVFMLYAIKVWTLDLWQN